MAWKSLRRRIRYSFAKMLGRPDVEPIPRRLQEFMRRIGSISRFRTIIDVGAYHGQFSWAALKEFQGATAHCFDPIPDEKLRQISSHCPAIILHQFAIGEKDGKAMFNANEFSASSSMLPMLDRHRLLWPKTARDKPLEVEIRRLDAFGELIEKPAFLKIDVQGYELAVLQGAEKVLSKVSALQVEINFELLYDGQPSFFEIASFLHERGFKFLEFSEERRMGPNKRLIYADAVFVLKDLC